MKNVFKPDDSWKINANLLSFYNYSPTGVLLIGPLGTNFREILIEIYTQENVLKCCLENGGHFVLASMCESNVKYHVCCWCTIMVMLFSIVFFLWRPLRPYWNILVTCETDKEPINPTRFPAPFASIIMYCCICTGGYSMGWYDCDLYYTMFGEKKYSGADNCNTIVLFQKEAPNLAHPLLSNCTFDETH